MPVMWPAVPNQRNHGGSLKVSMCSFWSVLIALTRASARASGVLPLAIQAAHGFAAAVAVGVVDRAVAEAAVRTTASRAPRVRRTAD